MGFPCKLAASTKVAGQDFKVERDDINQSHIVPLKDCLSLRLHDVEHKVDEAFGLNLRGVFVSVNRLVEKGELLVFEKGNVDEPCPE